jgi:hypothetical protein
MVRLTRRVFLMSSAALSAGCAMQRSAADAGASPPDAGASPAQRIRPPSVGQTWRYSKRDQYTQAAVYDQVDRIAAIDRYIEIDSRNQAVAGENGATASWGSSLFRKFFGRRDRPAGALPGEIQGPWGMVSVDPHWSQIQVYETPVPLWPAELRPGWQTRVSTRYKTPGDDHALAWDQTMKAHAWESISVPAGQFRALRYSNSIKFASGDFARKDCTRQETLWFAPEVGRWVARESTGSYYAEDSVADQPYFENAYRWELLEWT